MFIPIRCSPKDWQDKISKATTNTAIVPTLSLTIIDDHTNVAKDNTDKSEEFEDKSETNGLESRNFYKK